MYQYHPAPSHQTRHSNEVWYPGNGSQAPNKTHEEPLVIELEDDTDLFAEEEEVIRIRNMVIADLSLEDTDMYRCRACDFQSRFQTRLKSHISNRNFVGPAIPCKSAGSTARMSIFYASMCFIIIDL